MIDNLYNIQSLQNYIVIFNITYLYVFQNLNIGNIEYFSDTF